MISRFYKFWEGEYWKEKVSEGCCALQVLDMPTIILWSVIILLLLALLVLVLALYLLDNNEDKQAKRLQDVIYDSLSGSHLLRPWGEASSRRGTSCQTCHMCGGLRFRRPHGSAPAVVSDDAKSMQSLSSWGHWVAMKAQLASNTRQAFQKLVSRQKSQTKGEFLKRLLSFSDFSRMRGLGRLQDSKNMSMCSAATCVPTSVCSLDCSVGSASSLDSFQCSRSSSAITYSSNTEPPVLGSGSVGSSDCSTSYSESNPLLAMLDSHKSSDTQTNTVTDPKGALFHRLVLEILMSPSGNTDGKPQSSSLTNASGLRLKLETNATLEHLAGLTEALESKDGQKCEQGVKDVNMASLLCLPVDTLPKLSGTFCTSEDQDLQRLTQSPNGACCLPETGINNLGSPAVESTAVANPAVNTILVNRDCHDVRQKMVFAGLKECGQDFQKICDNSERESINSVASSTSTTTAVKHAITSGKLKLRIGNQTSKSTASEPAPQSKTENKEGRSLIPQGASVVSLDGLGSLHITFLKADAECEVQEEGSNKVSGQVASALAALNVASKLGGSVGGLVSGNLQKEKLNNPSYVHSVSSSSFPLKSAGGVGQGAGSNRGQILVEGEEHLLQASTCRSPDSDAGPSKKEKKKKKNRAKKQKVKTGAMISDAQEMQEIGKIALEAVKHVSAVPEREIGCVCGAPKGGLHSDNCPYPFTSSGSMLQRKIKEQYDDLVRSNAAKTLTLAQVGRFTTCLVEAKATLQQKSELIQRKFTIAKSLLSKADKSSFDRLCGQIYGLEMEQKKLEEDTVVYNRLQEQLKLSPAYKKMLEYGRAHFELQPHTGQMIEKLEPEDTEMSFEELLAQEKKDAFWQRHGLVRSAVQAS